MPGGNEAHMQPAPPASHAPPPPPAAQYAPQQTVQPQDDINEDIPF